MISFSYEELPQHLLQAVLGRDQFRFDFFLERDLPEITGMEVKLNPSPWNTANFQSSLVQKHLCLGVRHNEAWIAYAVCAKMVDEAELLIIGVDQFFQGRGLGKKLLQAIIAVVGPRVRNIFLEVRASNHVAIAMYEGLGFNCVGERPGYYKGANSSEDALIFALEILNDSGEASWP